ncbi:MAG: peptidoglycan editing factor PgeF [Chloroflexota bacterium]
MPFHQVDSLRYYTFESFDAAGVRHAIFTRHGGVSPRPWASLNLGGLIGDDLSRVVANRVRIFQALGRDPRSVYDVWQVHGNAVVCTDAPRPFDAEHAKADAITTDKPHITLLMRFADCVPIALYDPRRKVVGLVHAGWPGTVKRAAAAAVEAMQARYGSNPADILAGIGPSIGAHHYPVGPDVLEQVQAAFGAEAPTLLPGFGAATHFDLWAANRVVLEQAGVRKIETASLCTACHTDDWYSHRAEQGKTGRFGMVIHL